MENNNKLIGIIGITTDIIKYSVKSIFRISKWTIESSIDLGKEKLKQSKRNKLREQQKEKEIKEALQKKEALNILHEKYKEFRLNLLLNKKNDSIHPFGGTDINLIEQHLGNLSNKGKIYYFNQLESEIKQYIEPIINCKSTKNQLPRIPLDTLIDFTIIQHQIIDSYNKEQLPKEMIDWKLLGGFYDYFLQRQWYTPKPPTIAEIINIRLNIKAKRYFNNSYMKEIISGSYYGEIEWEGKFYQQHLDDADIGQPVNAPDISILKDRLDWRIKMVDYLFGWGYE